MFAGLAAVVENVGVGATGLLQGVGTNPNSDAGDLFSHRSLA
jgi:hypothetical protein